MCECVDQGEISICIYAIDLNIPSRATPNTHDVHPHLLHVFKHTLLRLVPRAKFDSASVAVNPSLLAALANGIHAPLLLDHAEARLGLHGKLVEAVRNGNNGASFGDEPHLPT